VMVYACLTPEDTGQFFYKHNSDWWNFHPKVQSFLTPPCIPLPTMVDLVGGDRTRDRSDDSDDIPWKRRIPSWRESTRVWSEWFRLVAGCPSPTESRESWATFRYDAEEWWQEFAVIQSETQHRINELAEWLCDRSDRRGEPNYHKELDERGVPRTAGNTTVEERSEWKRDREYQRDQLSLIQASYDQDMKMVEGCFYPDKENAYRFKGRWCDREGGVEPFWVRCLLAEDRRGVYQRGSGERRVAMTDARGSAQLSTATKSFKSSQLSTATKSFKSSNTDKLGPRHRHTQLQFNKMSSSAAGQWYE
jgi:hypothetical protein